MIACLKILIIGAGVITALIAYLLIVLAFIDE